jgi:hypothetical protein
MVVYVLEKHIPSVYEHINPLLLGVFDSEDTACEFMKQYLNEYPSENNERSQIRYSLKNATLNTKIKFMMVKYFDKKSKQFEEYDSLIYLK